MTIHLSILLFLPLLLAVLGGLAPRARHAGVRASSARSCRSATRCMLLVDFDTSARGLQYVTDDAWIDELASATRSASTA